MMSATTDLEIKDVYLNNTENALKYFCDENGALDIENNLKPDQIKELLDILFNSMEIHPEYAQPILKPVYYNDSDKISYIDVIFDGCGWDEWKDLELEFLSNESTIKGKVAVTCIKGLIE